MPETSTSRRRSSTNSSAVRDRFQKDHCLPEDVGQPINGQGDHHGGGCNSSFLRQVALGSSTTVFSSVMPVSRCLLFRPNFLLEDETCKQFQSGHGRRRVLHWSFSRVEASALDFVQTLCPLSTDISMHEC